MSADLQRIIRIVFQGDNETVKAFNQVNRDLQTMETAVRGVTGPMSDLADKALKLQAAFAGLATAGIAVAVKEAGHWSDSFNELTTLIDDTGDGVDDFRRDILSYSKDASFALDDINKSLYTAISAGIDYGDSLEYIAQAEKLAVAGKAELYETTKLMESVMNAYGASTDEAGHYSDILFQTVRQGLTTIPELADSLSRVTSIAAAAEVPFETVSAAIATLTAQGMPTAEAMTAIRGAIQAVIKPTDQAAQYAEKLGIEFNSQALASKGLEGVLMDVWEATDGNVDAVAQLFTSVQGLTGVLAMFGQDGGEVFVDRLKAMQDAAGATDDAYSKMVGNVELANQRLVNSIKAAFVEAGLPMLDDYTKAVDGLGSVFDGLSIGMSEGAFDPLYEVLNQSLQGLARWAEDVAAALPEAFEGLDFSRLISGLENLADELGANLSALFQDLDPTDPEQLNEILQTLIDSLGGLATTSGAIIKEWRPVMEMIGGLIERFSTADEKSLELTGSLLGVAQKAEFFYNTFGFLKGSLAMAAGEFMTTGENVSHLSQAFVVLKGIIAAIIAKKLFVTLATGITAVKAASALAIGSTAAKTGMLGLGATAAGLVAAGKIAAVTALLYGVYKGAEALGNASVDWFSDAEEEAEAAANRIAEVEVEIGKIKALTEEAIELNMKLSAPDPLTESEWEKIAADTRKQWEELGLDTDALKFGFEIERDAEKIKASTDIITAEIQKRAEEEPAEIPVELQVAELEAQSREVIAQIEATSEIVRESIRWKAELDIAEVEANARIMEAAFDSVAATIQSTGDVMLGLFDMLDDASLGDRSRMWTIIMDEARMREEAHDKQMQMLDAQIALMEERARAMERGDAMIQIDGQGLQPHLEAFMWEVLAAIQVRVNEEGMDMLLGQS